MDFSVLLGLVTSGAGMLFGKPRKRGARDAWQTAAETYGLLHKPAAFWSGPKLTGSLVGNELTVDMKDRNTASAATRFRLGMPPLNLGLRLRKKGFWNSLRSRIVTGDKSFDNQVVVEGRNEFAAREYLTPGRRKVIQNFLGSFKGAVVSDDEISIKTRGYVKKSDEMLGTIDAMMQVASVLSEEARPTTAISLTDTAETVAPEPEPAREPELAHTNEPEPEPEFEFDGAEVSEDVVDEPVEPEVDATASTDPLMSQENMPGVAEFCATVFAPGALSFSANQVFKESYQGERIHWTGTLESMTPYSFDFDFGSGRGTKAVLTILESEAAGTRNVQAVIGLPHDIEGLDERIGQSVSFTGRLIKVDGLAKRVLIADAEVRP